MVNSLKVIFVCLIETTVKNSLMEDLPKSLDSNKSPRYE